MDPKDTMLEITRMQLPRHRSIPMTKEEQLRRSLSEHRAALILLWAEKDNPSMVLIRAIADLLDRPLP